MILVVSNKLSRTKLEFLGDFPFFLNHFTPILQGRSFVIMTSKRKIYHDVFEKTIWLWKKQEQGYVRVKRKKMQQSQVKNSWRISHLLSRMLIIIFIRWKKFIWMQFQMQCSSRVFGTDLRALDVGVWSIFGWNCFDLSKMKLKLKRKALNYLSRIF